MRKRIFYFVLLALLVLQLGGLVFFIKILDVFFANETIAEMRYETKILSQHIDELMENPYPKTGFLENEDNAPPILLPPNEYRITIIDMSGKAIYDSMVDIHKESGDYSQHIEFLQAIQNKEGVSRPFSDLLKRKNLYYAMLAQRDNGEQVVLRMSASQSSILQVLLSLSVYLVLIVCALVLVSFLVAHFIARTIVKPLRNIDIHHLNKSFVYPEFDTFLHKINTQNRVIRSAIKRIRQKQQEFNTLISNMNDGLLLLKPSGEIITFNSSANNLIGKLDEVSNITEIESSDVSAAFLANCENTHWLDKHIQIGNKNIEIIQSPIYIKKKLHGTLILMHDVTQKVEFEELKKEFMANITHDLKTPITSIMVTSEMLHNGLIGADDSGRFVQSIFAESKRMLEMVNRILEISRFDEQNLTEYPKKLIDLHAIAARVSVRMDTIAQKKSISVSFAGESAQILGVEEMIENMLENLCDNAIKYSKENTAIRISLFHENNHIVLQVQDEGIGISKDDQQRVFERFFCVDKSRNKAINGIGLGLSIVKNIAHYHGATLTLESELDVGTCFTIRFPKQKML